MTTLHYFFNYNSKTQLKNGKKEKENHHNSYFDYAEKQTVFFLRLIIHFKLAKRKMYENYKKTKNVKLPDIQLMFYKNKNRTFAENVFI